MYYRLSLYLAENSSEERVKSVQIQKDVECILDCIYLF